MDEDAVVKDIVNGDKKEEEEEDKEEMEDEEKEEDKKQSEEDEVEEPKAKKARETEHIDGEGDDGTCGKTNSTSSDSNEKGKEETDDPDKKNLELKNGADKSKEPPSVPAGDVVVADNNNILPTAAISVSQSSFDNDQILFIGPSVFEEKPEDIRAKEKEKEEEAARNRIEDSKRELNYYHHEMDDLRMKVDKRHEVLRKDFMAVSKDAHAVKRKADKIIDEYEKEYASDLEKMEFANDQYQRNYEALKISAPSAVRDRPKNPSSLAHVRDLPKKSTIRRFEIKLVKPDDVKSK